MRRLLPLTLLVSCLVPVASASAVIGGQPASEAYPWMAAVNLQGDPYCGGSVVRADWVLTAAHCVDGVKAEDFSVILGRHKMSSQDGQVHEADSIVQNENYAGDGNDVALLHLAKPTTAAPLRTVSLSEAPLWAAGQPARVIGWGSSVFLVGPGSDDLMEVDLPMVSDDDCDTSYNGLSPYSFDPDTMVCAGEDMGLKDSCQGDSGGPLVVKDAAGAWTQVGVVSFGLGCGFPIYYGVYARVGGNTLNDWLAAHLPPVGSAPVPSSGGTAPSGSGPSGSAPPSGSATKATLAFSRKLGSAKKARRARILRLRLSSSGRVTGVRATLKRAGKAFARGHVAVVDGKATMLLPVKRSALTAGRVTVSLTAVDPAGRRIARTGAARLTR